MKKQELVSAVLGAKEFVILGVALLVSISIVWFFVIPSVQATLAKKSQLKAEGQILAKLTEKQSQLSQLDSETIRNQLAKASLALPSSKDIPGVYDSLVQLESLSGVIIDTVSVTPGNISTVSAEKAEELDVSITGRATLEGARAFLANVTTAPRLIAPKAVRFSSGETTGTLSITASVYFLGLPRTIPNVSEPVPLLTSEELEALGRIPATAP